MLVPFLSAIALAVIFAIVGASVARRKGRSAGGWATAAALFPPTVLVPLALPSRKPQEPQGVRIIEAPDGPTKTCPDCAETVRAAAKICRFCRHEFPADSLHATPQAQAYVTEGYRFDPQEPAASAKPPSTPLAYGSPRLRHGSGLMADAPPTPEHEQGAELDSGKGWPGLRDRLAPQSR